MSDEQSPVEEESLETAKTCPLCTHSSQWCQQMPAGRRILMTKNPLFACKEKESPQFGLWLAPWASCEYFEFSQARADEFEKDRERIGAKESRVIIPNGVSKALLTN